MEPAPETRPFRFGLLLDSREASGAGVAHVAQRAEEIGFSTLLGTDHVGRWSSTLLLLAAAEATTRLRIGTFVLNNDLRNPVMLAQELATLDMLSDGRLEVGIGAGWMAADYAGTGITLDPPSRRLRRLELSLNLIKRALTDGRVDVPASGDQPAMFVRAMPRSVQRPHPPFLVGGGGPRMLRFAAGAADIISLNPRSTPDGAMDPGDATSDAVDAKIELIREAAGPRWSSLELNANLFGLNPDPENAHGPAAPLLAALSHQELTESPHFLFGDVAEMASQLEERRRRWGLSYVVVRQADLDTAAPLVRYMQPNR